jgi:sulfate adenylyltransferase subunit 2
VSLPRRSHLRALEAEAVHVLREVAAQFERPVLLFSGGKDSIVMVELARRAFAPGPIPFPLLHVDTGHNFPETLAFRDWLVDQTGAMLHVASVDDAIRRGLVQDEAGPEASRNSLQTAVLLDALAGLRADAALGGGRRDEEKARAKERIFSHRDRAGQWDPRNQRPELWNLYNGRIAPGEHVRVFPLSNWTELDVWRYIRAERIAVPTLYLAHARETVDRRGTLLAVTEHLTLLPGETPARRRVRFRTVGDVTCTGAVESTAETLDAVVAEVAGAVQTERGGRHDDRRSETAMEDRKRAGYF